MKEAATLAAIALRVERAKDFSRILALLDSGSVSVSEIEEVAQRHDLLQAWQRFKRRFLDN